MRKLTAITILALLLAVATTDAYAAENKAIFMSPIVWRGNADGDYTFKDTIRLDKATIAADGSVVSNNFQGVCELISSCQTDGFVYGITANWSFTGKVTMEITTTGNSKDYVPVTNGVPLEHGKFVAGSKIKWRATLAPESALTELKIVYTDLSGVVGSFGSPELSGFTFRKPIYIKGSAAGKLFNYQMPIKVGESSKVKDCDAYFTNSTKSNFADIRFTQADQETMLAHYLEGVSEKAPNRTAAFWVKIPEIPKEGLVIYLYYGKVAAADLSDGNKVFDLFDDFEGTALDIKKWAVTLDTKAGAAEVSNSLLKLDAAKVTSTAYKFENGIIEYKGMLSENGAIAGIIRYGAGKENDRTAYSSALAGTEHCIAVGDKVKANAAKPISLNTFYTYRITAKEGEITFQRYAEGGLEPQAEVKYTDSSSLAAAPIGLAAGSQAKGVYFEWIRSRKLADPAPAVNTEKTKSALEETPNLPEFDNLTLAPNGDVILNEGEAKGEYTSQLIHSTFQTRIIVPSWDERRGTKDEAISISVAAKDNGVFYAGCLNGAAKYVSKKEFDKGDHLRWRAKFSSPLSQLTGQPANQLISQPANRLTKFTLEFQPGTITVTMPNGRESIKPGSKYNIFWEAVGYEPTYKMNLSYSDDGGKTFKAIARGAENKSNYAWVVPEKESDKMLVKVADAFDENVYGISDNYFSIGNVTDTSQLANQQAQEAAKAKEEKKKGGKTEKEKDINKEAVGGTKLYELLIKQGSAPISAKDAKDPQKITGLYQDGDVVMIKPAGYLWGASERSNFAIVQAYLTDDEVNKLMNSEEITKTDKDGRPVKEMSKRRKYKVDLSKQVTFKDAAAEAAGYRKHLPVVGKKAIIDKSVSQ